MVSRRKKIASAAIVLIAGLALAWPFRRAGSDEPSEGMRVKSNNSSLASASFQATTALSPTALTPTARTPRPIAPIAMQRLSGPVDLAAASPTQAALQKTTPATPAGLIVNDPFLSSGAGNQQIAPTPQYIRPQPPADPPPLAEDYRPELADVDRFLPHPVYASAARSDSSQKLVESSSLGTQRIHVVHNGDTLERLAKRYLGDERRALEIFDLNSETLTNPHLLPIGAEIFIPRDGKTVVEQ